MNTEELLRLALILLRGARRVLREYDPHLPIVEDITDFLNKAEKETA